MTDSLHRAGAIGADCARGQRFRAFGQASCISYPQGAIFGEAHIEIGSGTMIGPYVTLSAGFAPDQNLGDRAVVRFGDRVLLGRGSHVVGHSSIEIGDDVYTGPYVYITDQNHTYGDPEIPVGRQWPANQPVRIGAGSWLGAGAVILPGAQLGRNVVVAAGAVVRGEVPDNAVVAGVPAKVIRTYSKGEGWDPPMPHVDVDELDDDQRAQLIELLGVQ